MSVHPLKFTLVLTDVCKSECGVIGSVLYTCILVLTDVCKCECGVIVSVPYTCILVLTEVCKRD